MVEALSSLTRGLDIVSETAPVTAPATPTTPSPAELVTTTSAVAASSTGESTTVTSVTTTKPGVRTSEFWLSVAVYLSATVLFVTNKITSTEWTALTGGVAGLYALARSITKKG